MSGRARLAWWFLLVVSVILALFGIGDLIGGASVDPGITLAITGLSPSELQAAEPTAYRAYDFTTRTQGISLIVVGGLFTAIVLRPYRGGERWAWAAMWALPAWSLGVFASYLVLGVAPGQQPPPPMISGPIVGILGIVILLVDRSRFFGRAAGAPETPGTPGTVSATAG